MEEHTLEIERRISPKECLEKDSTKDSTTTDLSTDMVVFSETPYYPKEYTVIHVAEDDSSKESSQDSSKEYSDEYIPISTNSYELRSPEFHRIPLTSSPEYFADTLELGLPEIVNVQPKPIMTSSTSTYIHMFFATKQSHSREKKKTIKYTIKEKKSSELQKEIQHKRDLMNIQRTLSVSHFVPPRPDLHIIPNEQISPKVELCMEFLWCFPCCFYQSSCNLLFHCSQSLSACACNTTLYDIIWYMFYAPMFDNEKVKTTKTQKCILFVRLCFELYKTMIGSYLTVFTPQDCGNAICSLSQNLIPKDDLEIVALSINSVMAFSLLAEYAIEMTREKILRTYFENDQRLPVEKEYFTNLLGILDTKKASLLDERSRMISIVFRLYRRLGIILLSLYVVNVCISGIVIYKNYYDKSSLFGFVTNALFIVFKMASILKIAIHSINMPYSAYIETPVAFNSLKAEFIRPEIKKHFMFGMPITPNENVNYFRENKQYMRFLLDDFGNQDTVCLDIDDLPMIRHRKSFG